MWPLVAVVVGAGASPVLFGVAYCGGAGAAMAAAGLFATRRGGGIRRSYKGLGAALRGNLLLFPSVSSIFLYAAAIGATEPAAAAVIFECRTLFLILLRRRGGKEGDKFLRRSPAVAYALLAVALAGAGAVQLGARGWQGGGGLTGLWLALAAALADAAYQERSLHLAEAAPEPRLRLAWCAGGMAVAYGAAALAGAAYLAAWGGRGLRYPAVAAVACLAVGPAAQLTLRRANLGGGNLGANAIRFANPALAFGWLALYGADIARPVLFAAGAAVIGAAALGMNVRGGGGAPPGQGVRGDGGSGGRIGRRWKTIRR